MLRRLFIIGVVPLLLALCATTATADGGSATVPYRFYTVLDGLTQSRVIDIEQDQAGYLWFTTARGLNRFDGKDFDHYTIADGLPNNSLSALHVSHTNSIWVGDAKGSVTAIHGTQVVHSIPPMEGATAPVLDIEVIGERQFTVVEGFGIVEITSVDLAFVPVHLVGDASTGISDIDVHGDEIRVESSTGLYRLVLDDSPSLELLSDSIRIAHFDLDGTLWVADKNGLVGIWEDGKFLPKAKVESGGAVVSIVTDDRGAVWVATVNDLFSFEGGAEQTHFIGAPLKRYSGIDQVTSLFVDNENSLWISSSTSLIRFLGDRFRHFRLRGGSDQETVWSITEDLHSRMWFGTESKLIMRDTDETLTVIGTRSGVPKGPVRSIVADNKGAIWVGITAEGLYRMDVDTMQAQHIVESGNANVLDIKIAQDQSIWYSTIDSGVWRYEPGSRSLSHYPAPEDTSVYSLDIWPDGNVWYVADEVGLVNLAPDGEGGYQQEIVPVDKGVSNRLFNHIRLTGRDRAWFATEEGGLFHFVQGKFVNYGKDTPLADQTVYLVEPLDDGTIVVGGEQGLYQFHPGDPRIVHYNQQVGFVGLETNVHATFIDSHDYLWIGTIDGATRMDTTFPMPVQIEPTPTIVRVEAELDGRQILNNQELKPTEFGAHIEYAAISLLSPKGMEYSYKLVGADDGWSSPTTHRSVSYPRIPPGSYEFNVRARYPGSPWSREVASYRFTVLPYFWQQPWFVFGAAALFLLALRAFMIYRTRNIQRLNERLRAEVEERTQSIEQARRKLQESNDRLSEEVNARTEVETRFRRAFQNAPIGMGLLDAEGVLFDANPALKDMFWPESKDPPQIRFAEVVSDDDQERFESRYRMLAESELDELDEKLTCIASNGEDMQTVVNLSTVRTDTGSYLYSVLQIQDVTESLKLTSQLEYQASYDELTGLLNRRAFEAQLEKAWDSASAGGKPSYLMFMDLDQFKVVNDTSGHTAGDQLLRKVSEILIDGVRANDIVGRLGGDEFAVILWECPTKFAKRVAEGLRAAVENFRFHWDTETYRIGVSIGGLPIDANVGDISELQQLADAACYAAKEAGRNRVHMVDGDKDSARVHRGQVRWVQRIRDAMDNNRFAIYAQPIRPIVEHPGEPEQVEILLRLRDPESRKLIPPGAFLPAVERYGLSVELDKWVLRSLIHTLYVHQAFQAEKRQYWVNLSGSSVGDRRFADFLKDTIAGSPLPRGTINFEITETAVIRSISEAGELMSALRKMGCQFSLDDFGSGLSSFGYLKKLPVDFVKIDGMFIRDLLRDKTDQIFVKSIIDIAQTLGIKTIAEFVENEETMKIVTELGAEYAQGFVVGRPFVLAPRFTSAGDVTDGTVQLNKKAV